MRWKVNCNLFWFGMSAKQADFIIPEVREVQIKQQSAALFQMHPRHWRHAPGVHGWVARFSAGCYKHTDYRLTLS